MPEYPYRIISDETIDPAYEQINDGIRHVSPAMAEYFASLHPMGAMALLGDLVELTLDRFDIRTTRRDLLESFVQSFDHRPGYERDP